MHLLQRKKSRNWPKFKSFSIPFFNLAARYFLALRTSLLALRTSFIAHSPAGAGLGQELGYWTVPVPGALFVTGGRFWPIIGAAQDRAGKVLALRWWVGW
jgi:hypothetical protein